MEKDLKSELFDLKKEVGLWEREDLTPEENEECLKMLERGEELPEGVYQCQTVGNISKTFFRVYNYEKELTKEEIYQYILLKQHEKLTSIKKYIWFFVVYTIINIALSVLTVLASRL